jgi:hypothetical protein
MYVLIYSLAAPCYQRFLDVRTALSRIKELVGGTCQSTANTNLLFDELVVSWTSARKHTSFFFSLFLSLSLF